MPLKSGLIRKQIDGLHKTQTQNWHEKEKRYQYKHNQQSLHKRWDQQCFSREHLVYHKVKNQENDDPYVNQLKKDI